MSHTEGPWYSGPKHPECEVRYVMSDAEGFPVEVATLYYSDGEEQEANARLMAAAPEMLQALQVALKALESCTAGDYSTGHVIHQSFDEAAVTYAENAALAAIAKATEAK
jgi:hypothetical protein